MRIIKRKKKDFKGKEKKKTKQFQSFINFRLFGLEFKRVITRAIRLSLDVSSNIAV